MTVSIRVSYCHALVPYQHRRHLIHFKQSLGATPVDQCLDRRRPHPGRRHFEDGGEQMPLRAVRAGNELGLRRVGKCVEHCTLRDGHEHRGGLRNEGDDRGRGARDGVRDAAALRVSRGDDAALPERKDRERAHRECANDDAGDQLEERSFLVRGAMGIAQQCIAGERDIPEVGQGMRERVRGAAERKKPEREVRVVYPPKTFLPHFEMTPLYMRCPSCSGTMKGLTP
jgi:hypothetical protein